MVERIVNSNKLSMYLQIKEYIYNKICSGEYKVNSMIPSEISLANEFQVSRMTVNKAVGELVRLGYLRRFPGKGTFVLEGENRINPMTFFRFGDSFKKRGYTITSKVLNSKFIIPDIEVKNELKISLTKEVYFLSRLRMVNDEPIVLQVTYLNCEHLYGIEKINFAQESLYQTLKDRYQISFIRVDDKIRAVEAKGEIANELQVRQCSPIILLKRTSYMKNDIPIEFTYSYYKSDKYDLCIGSDRAK